MNRDLSKIDYITPNILGCLFRIYIGLVIGVVKMHGNS